MILVTGGTGFFGRHLVTRLVSEGRNVRVLSRKSGREASSEGAAVVRGDLSDAQSLAAALDGVETVIHAASVLPGESTDESVFEAVNAEGTGRLAALAREAGVSQFVLIGSAGIYGDGRTASPHREEDDPAASTAYERSKLRAETRLAQALEGGGVRWTVLRPQGLYGANRPATAAFFREVATRRMWFHPPVRVVVHPTHVSDLVQATIAVLEREDLDREAINVGGERALEFRSLVALVGSLSGHGLLQVSAPRWTGPLAGVAAGALGFAGRPSARLERWSRPWINRAVDTTKARRLLGFQPVPLDRALAEAMAELRRRNGK